MPTLLTCRILSLALHFPVIRQSNISTWLAGRIRSVLAVAIKSALDYLNFRKYIEIVDKNICFLHSSYKMGRPIIQNCILKLIGISHFCLQIRLSSLKTKRVYSVFHQNHCHACSHVFIHRYLCYNIICHDLEHVQNKTNRENPKMEIKLPTINNPLLREFRLAFVKRPWLA